MLGDIEFATMQETRPRNTVNYKWTNENRYSIKEYASEHRNTTALHNFQKYFQNIKEGTLREL